MHNSLLYIYPKWGESSRFNRKKDSKYASCRVLQRAIYIDLKGDEIHIEIKDNGVGIKDEHLEEVRKRGYSGGNSTGLGLNFMEDVVKNHGGKMYLYSKYMVGTSLKIIIPRVCANE